jgi:hypothetical protein
MNTDLREELLRMRARDLAVRSELERDGSLFGGYHPRMSAVHDEHADRLRAIIRDAGWPTERLVGKDGAEAAWLVAQHAINHPALMRECRDLLGEASARGDVPRWQFEYIDDRINMFEGRPQRFGTQSMEPGPGEPRLSADARKRFDADYQEWRSRVGWVGA